MILSELYSSFAGATSDSEVVFELEGAVVVFASAAVGGGAVVVQLAHPSEAPAETTGGEAPADAAPVDAPADTGDQQAPPADAPAEGDQPAS